MSCEPERRLRIRKCTATVLLILAGCAGPQPMPESGFDLSSPRAGSGNVTPEMVHPLEAGTTVFEVTTGEGTQRREHVLERTDRFDAEWSNSEGDRRVEFWRMDAAGNLVMPAVIDNENRAVSFFEPPLVVAYAELAPGESRQSQAQMRVVDLRTKRPRESGTAIRTITYVEDREVTTPWGRYQCKRLDVDFVADLRMADAHDTTTMYVAPGLGPVVELREEEVVVLGVVPSTRKATLVRVSGGQ